jgi:hypothetical protein
MVVYQAACCTALECPRPAASAWREYRGRSSDARRQAGESFLYLAPYSICGDRAWQQATTSCLHIESRFTISGSRSVENRLMFATPRLDDLTACANRSVGRQLPA